MTGKHKPEIRGRAALEPERPVIWNGKVPTARWFGTSSGWFDPVTLIMVAVALVNVYFGTWIVSALLVTAIIMRWYLVRRQSTELGQIIEHEVSPKGIRRGNKMWRWEEFSAWTVVKTKIPGVLDLVLRGQDGRSHTHIYMPEEAQPYVEVLADKRLQHFVP